MIDAQQSKNTFSRTTKNLTKNTKFPFKKYDHFSAAIIGLSTFTLSPDPASDSVKTRGTSSVDFDLDDWGTTMALRRRPQRPVSWKRHIPSLRRLCCNNSTGIRNDKTR